MSKSSKTDWKRLPTQQDQAIDTSDIPPLDDDFFNQATLHLPAKQPVTLRLDTDVLQCPKEQE
jgi:uncharacterized protein (DUF4415 family)